MKWINGRTWEAEKAYKKQWHRWFAWYPITIGYTGEGTEHRRVKVWLQYVERSGEFWAGWGDCGWEYDYREIQK